MVEHWSKDFVEHIRTVHFTLIALCVGLIALASFPSKTEIQIAHEQASEILEATNTWTPGFLLTSVENTVRTDVADHRLSNVILADDADFDVTMDGKYWYIPSFPRHGYQIKQKLPDKLRGDNEWDVRAPESLKSFQELWDDLAQKGTVTLPTKPADCYYFAPLVRYKCEVQPHNSGHTAQTKPAACNQLAPNSPAARKCEMQPHNSGHNAQTVEMEFQTFSARHEGKLPRDTFKWDYEFEYLAAPIFPIYEIVLPVRSVETIEFDGQKALVGKSQKWAEKNGRPFEDAFRELAAVDKPFENADIGSAERILDAEAKRTGDAFEAVGLKIPAEIAVRFGVLFILAVQLYLWIHLHEFGNRADHSAGFEVAWIGVYVSRAARVVLLISVLGLPIGTVALLTTTRILQTATGNKWKEWIVFCGANLACWAISYCLYRALPQVPSSEPVSQQTIDSAPANNGSPHSGA